MTVVYPYTGGKYIDIDGILTLSKKKLSHSASMSFNAWKVLAGRVVSRRMLPNARAISSDTTTRTLLQSKKQ